MITRVSEAHVRPGQTEAFLADLRALVADFPIRYTGLISHEVLIDMTDTNRIQYISRWVDSASLVAYAGADWAEQPVTFPREEAYLVSPLTLRHFTSTP